MQFSAKIMPNNRLEYSLWVGASSGKSWIRHWIVFFGLTPFIQNSIPLTKNPQGDKMFVSNAVKESFCG